MFQIICNILSSRKFMIVIRYDFYLSSQELSTRQIIYTSEKNINNHLGFCRICHVRTERNRRVKIMPLIYKSI